MNKEEQKKLLIEVMEADEKDGLYEHWKRLQIVTTSKFKTNNMEKQTAVEWLKSKVLYIVPSSQKDDLLRLFEQAKQMEKDQRIKDYNAGYSDAQCNHVNDAENYVNEQNYLSSKD